MAQHLLSSSRPQYDYRVPVQSDSPWPTFRRDHRNTGFSPIAANYHGDQSWSFRTGKGIFSTPVIDGDGTIYVGSADHYFYAINPDGSLRWRFQTGELIDSAGALPQVDPAVGRRTVLCPSGDGYLYYLYADDGSLIWKFDARVSPRASYNNWFEGNVAIGYDGTIYAGNTNFNYYAITPDGRLKWTYQTGANAWSLAAFADDGTIFWASNDTFIHAVRPDGSRKWRRRTLGFLAASAAIGSDGTVFIGSFDSFFYALDPETGRVRWKFKTGDHIYSSAALSTDTSGNTNAIYFGSTDGIFYALRPDGKLLWAYDTGAPIRSSPVVGRAPAGEEGNIVYFGCGNGKLYALNAADGTRRWSYDMTVYEPELRDRNDLNGSPALGVSGIYIGGEHGCVWYMPYDYPLHVADERAQTDPGEDLPADTTSLFYVSPGGSTCLEPPKTLPPATLITLRLVVRKQGKTINARVYNAPVGRPKDALQVTAQPDFPLHVEPSADGRYIHVIPEGFLEPGISYTLTIKGIYYIGGLHIGNLTLGGRRGGRFETSFTFRIDEAQISQLPLASVSEDSVPALEWTRLSVPLPTMMPSLNQIGFDYMDWIIGTVMVDEQSQRIILWAVGGLHDVNGVLVPDADTDFALPLSGTFRGNAFILRNRRFTMAITGIPIPFNLFELRGQLDADGRVRPGAVAYADTKVLSIPTFGPYLVIAGLANNWWQKLLAVGTYITRPYDARGLANQRPAGISVASLNYVPPARFRDGKVSVAFTLEAGAIYPLSKHRPSLLLVDADRIEAIPLDYHACVSAEADAGGNLASATLTIPAGTQLPESLEAVVILDVFPLFRHKLSYPSR